MERVKPTICAICHSKKSKDLLVSRDRMYEIPGEFTVKSCETCGFTWIHPQPTATQLKKHYPSYFYYSYTAEDVPSFLTKLRNYSILHSQDTSFLNTIIQYFIHVPAIPTYISKGRIMDIGCGSGYTLSLLKKIGWDVYGLEIDKHAVVGANKRGLSNVSLGRSEDLKKYPNNYFDVIRLYHVIEHLDNPVLSIELCYKKLKKGGSIIIGTPNIESLVAKIGREYWYNLDSPRHVFLFSPSTLSRLLRKTKFRSISVDYYSAGGIAGTIQYLLKERFGFNVDLVNSLFIILLFFPLEWLLDKIHLGDVFTITAKK